MTDKKRKLLVFAALAAAIIWGVWNNPFASRKEVSTAESVVNADSDPDPGGEQVLLAATVTDFSDLQDWKNDPFARKKAQGIARRSESPADPSFRVSVISRQNDCYMAVVNGKVVQESDSISGWTVTEINDDSVLLTKGTRRLKLTLKGS